jgi:hypothetical protein
MPEPYMNPDPALNLQTVPPSKTPNCISKLYLQAQNSEQKEKPRHQSLMLEPYTLPELYLQANLKNERKAQNPERHLYKEHITKYNES